MKTNLFALFIIASLFMVSCNSSKGDKKERSQNTEQHSEDDGHDHSHDHDPKQMPKEVEEPDDAHADEIVFTEAQAKEAGLETEVAIVAPFRNVIKTSGQIQTPQGNEQTIIATSAGVVSFTNASIAEGASVRVGESIVSISAKNLQDGDPAIKSKIAFETAEKEYHRAQGLVSDKIISDKEFEQVRLRYETAKAAFQAQAANITATGIRVTSPISGYIKNRLVNQGEYVTIGQPIATVAQNSRLQLRAEVSENYFKYLRNVTTANFKTTYDDDFYKLTALNGKLLSYGKTSNSNSFYIPITFEFDNIEGIIPGSFTEVYLLSNIRENVLSVPITALTEEQGLNFVYVQIEPEAFKKQEVTIGQSNGDRIEILKGLRVGQMVVTRGVTQVKLAASSSAIPDGHNH